MKGGQDMGCKHENLRCVNNRLFCKDCGEELPLEYLTGTKAENPPADEKPKSPAKKRTAKKAE